MQNFVQRFPNAIAFDRRCRNPGNSKACKGCHQDNCRIPQSIPDCAVGLQGARVVVVRMRQRSPFGSWLDALQARVPLNVVVTDTANKPTRIVRAVHPLEKNSGLEAVCSPLNISALAAIAANSILFHEVCLRQHKRQNSHNGVFQT